MRRKTAIVCATAVFGTFVMTTARATDYTLTGKWELSHHEADVLPVHAALLPTDELDAQVLIMAGSGNDPTFARGLNEVRLWSGVHNEVYGVPGGTPFPADAIPTGDPPTHNDNDIFCAGHVLLPDGKVFAAGGNLEYPSWHGAGTHPAHSTPPNYDSVVDPPRPACHGFMGLRDSFVYDPWAKQWTRGPKMDRGRWYPTLLSLGNGHVFTISGLDDLSRGGLLNDPDWLPNFLKGTGCRDASLNETVEIYNPATSSWSAPMALGGAGKLQANNIGLYPYMHLLPNGNVFLAGPTNQTQVINPNTLQVLSTHFSTRGGWRDYGHSALLGLSPSNGYAARVLNVGGAGDNQFENRAEIINFSDADPQWQPVAPMSKKRFQGVSVLLPDGKLLMAGGGEGGDTTDNSHLNAEMYDPAANTWIDAGQTFVPRMYHSVGILMPDGRVFVGGSNPHDSMDPNEHAVEERIEVYSPPYMFKGERAQIPSHPEQIHYGASFDIRMSTAAFGRQAVKAVLMRPGSTTHTRNFDQRLVELTMTKDPDVPRKLTLTAPPNGNIAPPGYYLLFVLNAQGVPSYGHLVKLS